MRRIHTSEKRKRNDSLFIHFALLYILKMTTQNTHVIATSNNTTLIWIKVFNNK